MAKVKKKKKTKAIKKKWIKLYAPALFKHQELGETYVADNKLAIGKTISVNLMNLTRDPKKQNVYVSFKVTGLKKEGAETEFFRYKLSNSAVKRFVRRNKDKVEDSFDVKTTDKKLRIKPIIITRNKVSKPTQTDIRKKARDYILYKLSKQKIDVFAGDLINKKFQKGLTDVLRKISPIAVSEVRDVYVKEEKVKA